MTRFLAGALASFLMLSGAFLLWQGRAEQSTNLPPAPAKAASAATFSMKPSTPPESTARSREEKRFQRADKNRDGKIGLDELLQPRRKPFAKIDSNGDGKLSFEEWASKTVDKFRSADANRDGILTRAEYATTAPKPAKKPRCGC